LRVPHSWGGGISPLLPVTCWEPCKEVSNGLRGARLLWLSPKSDHCVITAVIPNTPGAPGLRARGKRREETSQLLKTHRHRSLSPSPPCPQPSALPPTLAKPLLGLSHPGNGCLPHTTGCRPLRTAGHWHEHLPGRRPLPDPPASPSQAPSVFPHWQLSRGTPEEGEEPSAGIRVPAG